MKVLKLVNQLRSTTKHFLDTANEDGARVTTYRITSG